MLQPKDEISEKMWAIYERHESYIYHRAYGRVKNKEDAENITQMCFLKIFSDYHKLKKLEESKLREYVKTVTRNTIYAYRWKKRIGRLRKS